MQLIVLCLVACAAACSSSYPRTGRVVGYDQIPTEYGVAVNGIIDKDLVNDDERQQDTNDNHDKTEDANDVLDILLLSLE